MSQTSNSPSTSAVKITEAEERAAKAENAKNMGNDYFRKGMYKEAAERYNAAAAINGTQPTYMSNLAATYLKLEDYELAESAAGMALLSDPRMIKARFRRGLARKATRQLRAAATDFVTVLKLDPDCAEAKTEYDAVCQRIRNDEDDESNIWESDHWDHPPLDAAPKDPLPLYELKEIVDDCRRAAGLPVDSEDASGQDLSKAGIPCKHHNRKPLGCAKGSACSYSHEPDARSVPDNEGRNVCLYFLMGSCRFGERCFYSHSKENLSEDWTSAKRIPGIKTFIRDNEAEIRDRRYLERYMGKGPFAPEPVISIKRAIDEIKAEKAYEEIMDAMFAPELPLPEPFILHLTLNKSTEVPKDILASLRELVDVARVKKQGKALDLLAVVGDACVGIFITDAGITLPKHKDLLSEIVSYARNGGTVVLGGMFKLLDGSKQVDLTPAQFENFFQQGWGLSWKLGAKRPRKMFARNRETKLKPVPPAHLPDSLSLNAIHLAGVRADAALYLPVEHSPPGSNTAAPRPADLVETPVVVSQFGEGRLCFMSDPGADALAVDVVLAMFGLPSLRKLT
ncbi:RNA polymerase II-associated protein 3 [Favolaschia claudopus]|uniref:RNA polymerase II-associated protein 3 n=1 Tax=Favolaschia claudopus TaxID=2862362 RepID=A0AAW0CBR5_9AGAR